MEIEICKNCGCCGMDWEDCYNCEDGFSYHDCGEDTCCCRYPTNNVLCDICEGKGGWDRCVNENCGESGHSKDVVHAEL